MRHMALIGGENGPPNTFSDVLRSTDGGLTWTTINVSCMLYIMVNMFEWPHDIFMCQHG